MPDKNETQLTTIQTDLETSRMLGLIAAAHERSKAAQVRVLIKREYDKLARLKLLPADENGSSPAGYQSIAE